MNTLRSVLLLCIVLDGTQTFARYIEFPLDEEFSINTRVQRTLQSIGEDCKIFDCHVGKCWQLVDENCITEDHIRRLTADEEDDNDYNQDEDDELDGVVRKLLRSGRFSTVGGYGIRNVQSAMARRFVTNVGGAAPQQRDSTPAPQIQTPPCNGQPLSTVRNYPHFGQYLPRTYIHSDSLGQTSDAGRDQLRQQHVKQAADHKTPLEFAFFIVNGWNGQDYIADTCQQVGLLNLYFPWAVARVSLDPGQAICNYLKARFPTLLNIGTNAAAAAVPMTSTAPQDDGFTKLFVLRFDMECIRSQVGADIYSYGHNINNLHVVLNNIFDDEVKSSTTLGSVFAIPVACIKNEKQYTKDDIKRYVSQYGCNSNRFNDDFEVGKMQHIVY